MSTSLPVAVDASSASRAWRGPVVSMLVSTTLHTALLVLLGLTTLAPQIHQQLTSLVSTANEPEKVEKLEDPEVAQSMTTEMSVETSAAALVDGQIDGLDAVEVDAEAAAPVAVQVADVGLEALMPSDLDAVTGSVGGAGLEGRGAAAKADLLRRRGGTLASEAAVGQGLKWLAAHQEPKGGWNFDHRDGACNGRCGNPGLMRQSTTGATGLALLPFLGAGQTHLDGEYQEPIGRALDYLVAQMNVNRKHETGSLIQGAGMYDHAIATIVLCEAYALTHDEKLREPAQLALNFIVRAQDPQGGGWRYSPGMPGDTSAVGWQLMALKSGHLAYLHVPQRTVEGAVHFLNSVTSHGGIAYGYVGPEPEIRPGTTAVGLLCRMYTGWEKKHAGLRRGVQYLSDHGPSPVNMYFNYYATQVLCHWEGPEWKTWNATMREFLIDAQAKKGHEAGSWFFPASAEGHDHGERQGGRLYFTCLATMILEVYYRHLPLYGHASAEENFD